MGVMVSSSHVVSAAPCPSGDNSSHSAPAPARAWETVFHKLSNASPSHGLQLFTNCPSMGPSPRVQSFRNRLLQHGSPWGHQPCQQTCSGVGSSLPGSAGSGRSLPLSTGSQLPSGIPLLQPWGPFHGLQVEICSTVDLHGMQGTACLTMVFITSCKGRVSAPTSRAPPPPPSSLTVVSAELFLSHRLTPLSRLPFSLQFVFPPS